VLYSTTLSLIVHEFQVVLMGEDGKASPGRGDYGGSSPPGTFRLRKLSEGDASIPYSSLRNDLFIRSLEFGIGVAATN